LAHIVSIVRMHRVISWHVLEAVFPLGRGSQGSEIEVEFGHAEGIGTSFAQCGDDLLMFVAKRVHREALNILKNEAEGLIWFG